MSDKKVKKSLMIFLGILFSLVIATIVGIVIWQETRYITDAELSDFEWPYGQMLIIFSDNDYDYEKSTNGKINAQFRKNEEAVNGWEILSLTKHLRFGKLEGKEKGLYYITPEEVKLVSSREKEMNGLSLSPNGDFIRYESNDKLCVATFSETELGECVDLFKKIPGDWDWENQVYSEGDWYKEGGEYLVIVRSKTDHDLEDAGWNQPQRRVQKIVTKFSYNPVQRTFRELEEDENYILKTSMSFETEEEKDLRQYFSGAGLYDFIYDRVNGRVLIRENSTGHKAELATGKYFGDMPAFDVRWSADFGFLQ